MQTICMARYQEAAKVAREKAMRSRDSEQWRQIAAAWDQLARHIVALSPPKQSDRQGNLRARP